MHCIYAERRSSLPQLGLFSHHMTTSRPHRFNSPRSADGKLCIEVDLLDMTCNHPMRISSEDSVPEPRPGPAMRKVLVLQDNGRGISDVKDLVNLVSQLPCQRVQAVCRVIPEWQHLLGSSSLLDHHHCCWHAHQRSSHAPAHAPAGACPGQCGHKERGSGHGGGRWVGG